MKIVKDKITPITKPIVHICNVSLANGQFPDEMKVAKVVPLYKANDIKEFNNYRPVSIPTSIFKNIRKKCK